MQQLFQGQVSSWFDINLNKFTSNYICVIILRSYYEDAIEIEDSLLAYSIPGIGPVSSLLPMLQTSKCLNSCRANSFKRKDFEISYGTIDAFFSKNFYLVVQWAYNKVE